MNIVRAQPELDSTFGCLYLSAIFSTTLWGVGCVQMYFYYEKYFVSDKWQLKLYVFLIWALDTVHQALLLQSLYVYLVKEFGNFLFLMRPQATLIDCVIFAALVDTMVQLLFIVRVWHLSNKNYLVTGSLVIVVLAQLAVTLTYFGQVYHFTSAVQLLSVLETERAMNAFVVIADTLIASVLIFLLWKRRSGVRKTDSIIKRLVMYTIGTSLVTSLWGIVGLVGAQELPASFIYLLVDLVMPKLYFNCMLASLNARSRFRENHTQDGGVSIRLENLPTSSQDGSNEDRGKKIAGHREIDHEAGIELSRESQMRQKMESNVYGSSIDIATTHSAV